MNMQPVPYIELYDALQFADQQNARIETIAQGGAGMFRVEMLDDIEANPVKVYLVKDLLAVGEASCIFGETGSGKSIIAAEIALAVAAGIPWLGREVVQSPTFYFAGERADLLRRRLMGLKSRLALPPGVPFGLSTGPLDIVSDESAAGFIDRLLRFEDDCGEGVGFVCIDTLAPVIGGGDENGNADMSKAMQNVESIRARTGAHVCLIHHVGASLDAKQRLRGATAINGAIDTSLLVSRGADGGGALTVKKNNDGRDNYVALHFELKQFPTGQNETGEEITIPHTALVNEPSKVKMLLITEGQKQVLAALQSAIKQDGEADEDGVIVAPLKTWRAVYYESVPELGVSARKMNFIRGVEAVTKTGRVAQNGDLCWPT